MNYIFVWAFFSSCFYPKKLKGKVTNVSKEPCNAIKRSNHNGISAGIAHENERNDHLLSTLGLGTWKLSTSPTIPGILQMPYQLSLWTNSSTQLD